MTNRHCHLCGATLRRAEQFRELARPDRDDVFYLCRDETRCATRATLDLSSIEPHRTRASVGRGDLNTMLLAAGTARVSAASLECADGRRGEPLGQRLTLVETEPIRVHQEDGGWQVDYGSYAQGYHRSREEAIEKATTDAARENRELTIEDAETTG
jgi:hypothetical protein